MTTAVFAGPDSDGLGEALAGNGVDVSYVEGMASRPKLEEAGIHDAELLVLTDVGQATAVPIAKDINEDLRVVFYTGEGLPEFVSAMKIIKMDPALLGPDAVAEELLNGA